MARGSRWPSGAGNLSSSEPLVGMDPDGLIPPGLVITIGADRPPRRPSSRLTLTLGQPCLLKMLASLGEQATTARHAHPCLLDAVLYPDSPAASAPACH